MREYPFQDKVRSALDIKKQKLAWLVAQFEKSERWFYNIKDFTKLEIGEVEKFSVILDTNFMADYNEWRISNHQDGLFMVAEPDAIWQKPLKRVSIQLKITAAEQVAEDNLSKMFAAIRREGQKLGFEIE
ncbi:MAG TPA: hypothetical protein VGM63_09145 [Mucilaginibacter sp.]|jgi:hypothetical protein